MSNEMVGLLKSFADNCFKANDTSNVKNIHDLNLMRNVPFSYMAGYIKACLDFGYISDSEHKELSDYIKEVRGKL